MPPMDEHDAWLEAHGLEPITKAWTRQAREAAAAKRRSGYREEPGSSFTHQGRQYDLNRVLERTDGRRQRETKTKKLSWVLEHDRPDSQRVAQADPSKPLLVARTKTGKPTVVDGLHRLQRASDEGIQRVPTRRVTRRDLKSARIR